MITFDDIEPQLISLLRAHREVLAPLGSLLINRDLNGRVRIIAQEDCLADDTRRALLDALAADMRKRLGTHVAHEGSLILYEPDLAAVAASGLSRPLAEDLPEYRIVDRLATGTRWATVEEPSSGAARRIVFFSIKGGVGRSTALAACARHLSQRGRKVMVVDLDLESPGLSSSLLPDDRCPRYGVTDWMVEDLVGNADEMIEHMAAVSDLSELGDIRVVPAHGAEPGDYLLKLGRVWMPRVTADRATEPWPRRLNRLINALEAHYTPDVVLIDSRSGIDETASAVVTDLGAHLVCLFAIHGAQTWTGYRILFEHWKRAGVVKDIRDRLQIVAGLVPEIGSVAYVDALRQASWDLFGECLYDEVEAGATAEFSFDLAEPDAPHQPWAIHWNRGFAALERLHGNEVVVDDERVRAVFGEVFDGLDKLTPAED
ncbi:ParA family protein [Tistrella mobilis]|uniref:ParA family protein n=1 Tax=Tistrella mobilis TaxID=171437 RepID=UPI00059F9CD2|nr:AAA family ATPase [Tistrella mobilis]